MFPALEAVLGLLHPVAGGVLRRRLKFQTCTNNLNQIFKQFREFLGPLPPVAENRLFYFNNVYGFVNGPSKS
jgi:hypothetical protein